MAEKLQWTEADRESARRDRLNEVGSEPPCPFCGVPRVSRSVYIRCNLCGVNWEDSELHLPNYLNMDPRVARAEAARMVTEPRRAVVSSMAGVED